MVYKDMCCCARLQIEVLCYKWVVYSSATCLAIKLIASTFLKFNCMLLLEKCHWNSFAEIAKQTIIVKFLFNLGLISFNASKIWKIRATYSCTSFGFWIDLNSSIFFFFISISFKYLFFTFFPS